MSMDPQPLHWLAAACGVTLDPSPGTTMVRRVVTDSRVAGPGDLFVALRGERFDGHDFLSDVAARGVAGVLFDAKRPAHLSKGVVALEVADPRVAYGQLAGRYRRRFTLPVICVGGSNGKTTTKELIAAVLAPGFSTLKSEASFNNDIGVPATLLQMESHHGAAVLEAGTNHPGELAPLVRLIAPRIGVLTSFGREHLEFFGDLAGVVQEEGTLAEELPPGGTLVLDGDSPFTDGVAQRTQPGVNVVRIGHGPQNHWRVHSVSQDWDGLTFRVDSVPHPDWSGVWRVPLPGEHSAQNATYALAVAAELGINPAAARTALAAFHPPKQRLALTRVGELRILDDTYNANADSMLAALRTLSDLPCTGRRVAVLGDMGELGPMTETAHVEVGQASAQGMDALFAIGQWATATAAAAQSAGLGRAHAFASVESALPVLREYLQPGDTLLVKASRSARLEQVIRSLQETATANPPVNASTAASVAA